MKDKKNKDKLKIKLFKGIFTLLFLIFITMYVSEESGYYEFKNNKTKELTQKQIEKFESDVALGKEVDIEDYVVTKDKNYQNKISKMGLNVSNTLSTIVKKSLDGAFSFMVNLVEN